MLLLANQKKKIIVYNYRMHKHSKKRMQGSKVSERNENEKLPRFYIIDI